MGVLNETKKRRLALCDFSNLLSALLKERRLSLAEVNRATGIPISTLSEWCAGREPKLSGSVVKLANYLGVSLDDLAGGVVRTAPFNEIEKRNETGTEFVHELVRGNNARIEIKRID